MVDCDDEEASLVVEERLEATMSTRSRTEYEGDTEVTGAESSRPRPNSGVAKLLKSSDDDSKPLKEGLCVCDR